MTNTEGLFLEAIAKISRVFVKTKLLEDAMDYLKEIQTTIVNEMNATKKRMWENGHRAEKLEELVESGYREGLIRAVGEDVVPGEYAWRNSNTKKTLDELSLESTRLSSAEKIEKLTALVKEAFLAGPSIHWNAPRNRDEDWDNENPIKDALDKILSE